VPYESALSNIPWFIRLSALPKVILIYLKMLIAPIGLHMPRQFTLENSNLEIFFGLSSLGLLIITSLYLLRYSAERRVWSFMFFWGIVFFIPQSGIFPINTFIAEHFIYLPSISFFLLLAFILHKALRRPVFILAICGACAFYILLSASRNLEWANPVVFYKNIIGFSPQSYQAHNNLGWQYELKGQPGQAIAEYKLALEVKPDMLEARLNLARVYLKLKRFSDARNEYTLAKNTCPPDKLAVIENKLANVYQAEGFIEQAVQGYKLALKLDPEIVSAKYNLARLYYLQGDFSSAGLYVLESLKEITSTARAADSMVILDFLENCGGINNPEQFYSGLGAAFIEHGRWEAAVSAYNRCLELNPVAAGYYYNLGIAYLHMNKMLQARHALRQALRINPNHIRAKRLINKNRL
jgi:tetratricopeptide (TPR) repeat protein